MDKLHLLWNSGLGDITCQLVRQLSPSFSFTTEQSSLRDQLNKKISAAGLGHPFSHQLLLSIFLLSPPGLLKVANAEQQLPPWLASAYKDLYENISVPVTLGGSSLDTYQAESSPSPLPAPDFGQFPNSLDELIGNRIQLNRLLGLSNLYYIDPEDQEIKHELTHLRRSLVPLIQSAPSDQLERIWSTDFGDRYWALVRSGVQNEPFDSEDRSIVEHVTQQLNPKQGNGFSMPSSINFFLVAMMYYKPGMMRVDSAEHKLPIWLLEPYRQVFEQSITPV